VDKQREVLEANLKLLQEKQALQDQLSQKEQQLKSANELSQHNANELQAKASALSL